jgi:hypothetical protein
VFLERERVARSLYLRLVSIFYPSSLSHPDERGWGLYTISTRPESARTEGDTVLDKSTRVG